MAAREVVTQWQCLARLHPPQPNGPPQGAGFAPSPDRAAFV